jgi:hypothetical protein
MNYQGILNDQRNTPIMVSQFKLVILECKVSTYYWFYGHESSKSPDENITAIFHNANSILCLTEEASVGVKLPKYEAGYSLKSREHRFFFLLFGL